MKVGPLKDASKTVQLKDDRKYISSNNDDKLQDNFLKIVESESKDDDYSVKILSLKKVKIKNE